MPKREWSKEPPAQRRQRGKYNWEEITADLRAHPGMWTVIDKEAAIHLPGAITRKRMKALRSDEWDYLVMTTDNNRETRTCKVSMSAVRKDET